MNTLKSLLPDALMVVGASAISAGTWLIYEPAGWIIGGGFSLLAGVLIAKAK